MMNIKAMLLGAAALTIVDPVFEYRELHAENYCEIGVQGNPVEYDVSNGLFNYDFAHLDGDNAFLFSNNFRINKDSHSLRSGVGVRTLATFGVIGLNCHMSASRMHGFYGYHLSPGCELMTSDWQFSYCFNLPTEKRRIVENEQFRFHHFSEFSIGYCVPRNNIEFEITPILNHVTKKMTLASRISLFLDDHFQLGIHPFFESKKSGLLFSIVYAFGSDSNERRASRRLKPMRRSERCLFSQEVLQHPVKEVVAQKSEPVLPVQNRDSMFDFFFPRK
jgi:hypothetical protein